MTPENATKLIATAGKKPCRNGHLCGRNKYGQCVECKRASAARKYRRRNPSDHCPKGHPLPEPEPGQHRRRCAVCLANAVAAGRYRKKRCANGHDISDNANVVVLTNGRHCATCLGLERRQGSTKPRARAAWQPCVSDELRDSRLTTAILEWDARIENELRAWVREDLREQKARHLAEIRGRSLTSRI